MANSILPQDQNGRELFNAISSFFCTFSIGNLLRKCNAQKEKGVPVIDIFKYKLCNVFSDRSMYMQQKTGSFRASFSKTTYRCMPSFFRQWAYFIDYPPNLNAAAHLAVTVLTYLNRITEMIKCRMRD